MVKQDTITKNIYKLYGKLKVGNVFNFPLTRKVLTVEI